MKTSVKTLLLLLVLIVATFAYLFLAAVHARLVAKALLQDAKNLEPGDSAESIRELWKSKYGSSYEEYSNQNFGVHISNEHAARWHVVKPAVMEVDVSARDGLIHAMRILYYGSSLAAPPAVMLRESFSAEPAPCKIQFFDSGGQDLWRVSLHFGRRSRTDDFFKLQLGCMSSVVGCDSPEVLFPDLRRLRTECTVVQHQELDN